MRSGFSWSYRMCRRTRKFSRNGDTTKCVAPIFFLIFVRGYCRWGLEMACVPTAFNAAGLRTHAGCFRTWSTALDWSFPAVHSVSAMEAQDFACSPACVHPSRPVIVTGSARACRF